MEARKEAECVWERCPQCETFTPMIRFEFGEVMRYRCVNCNLLFERKLHRKRQFHP